MKPEQTQQQKLLERTAIDPTAADFVHNAADSNGLPFGLPLWMLLLIVLILALAGVGVIKVKGQKESNDSEADDTK